MYYKEDEVERRCLPASELRIDGEGDSPKIVGYAAVFDTWTDIGGWFRESIKPGAFKKSIKENDVRALLNHDPNFVLGRNKSGTLTMREDKKGLAVEITPSGAGWVKDLIVSMKRGDVDQMSFAFNVNKQEIDHENDTRVLEDVTLFDVSVVTYPAYPTTSAEVRSVFKIGEKDDPVAIPVVMGDEPKEEVVAEAPMGFSELDRILNLLKEDEVMRNEVIRVLTTPDPDVPPPPAKKDRWQELVDRAEAQARKNAIASL